MRPLRKLLDEVSPHFHKGGKLEKFYALYEMVDTFMFTPGEVTKGETHVRDGIDLKRTMVSVAVALFPCILMAMYNTGYQANLVIQKLGITPTGWRADVMTFLGLGHTSTSCLDNFIYGALFFVPVFLVTNIVGGLWEVLFATVRKHEINEGFLVTGILFPLTLPATIPLWQVAIGISFGVVIAKEVFGGTGKNFLNVALASRAFLFFAYPGQISGDSVWVAVDGHSGATALAQVASGGMSALSYTWKESFLGLIPGSMGETSTLACLLGAAYLLITGIASWRIMLSLVLSSALFAFMLNTLGSSTNPLFALTPQWHLVLGGFAFGCVFMATDPVTGSMTQLGQWFYGGLIGLMVILIRVINPAFPEGMMLAILFGNLFAPLIDYFVVKSFVRRRRRWVHGN